MNTGISYIIEVLKSGNGKKQEISIRQLTEAIREGVKSEPERFPELVHELEARIHRASGMSINQARSRALLNIAGYVVMADHDFKTEMMIRAAMGGPLTVEQYLDSPREYGLAMQVLASYVGLEGIMLRRFIFEQQLTS